MDGKSICNFVLVRVPGSVVGSWMILALLSPESLIVQAFLKLWVK
jgi:hypothetical protein